MAEENGNEIIKMLEIDSNSIEVELIRERITQIANLEHLHRVEVLRLRWNIIKKIENLSSLSFTLVELDLSDNQINEIGNLELLFNLKILDLSYNRISCIEGLDFLTNLETLFLTHNKIKKIQGLENLLHLKHLELGNNQITKIENLDNNVELQYLYLGANQIDRIENLDILYNIEIFSIPCNGIEILKGLDNLVNLKQLSVCQNGIEYIGDALKFNIKLEILDLNNNRLKYIDGISQLSELTDFWAAGNEITKWSDIDFLAQLPNLKFVYLHSNPFSKNECYRRRAIQALQQVTTIDGDNCRQ